MNVKVTRKSKMYKGFFSKDRKIERSVFCILDVDLLSVSDGFSMVSVSYLLCTNTREVHFVYNSYMSTAYDHGEV